MEHLPSWARDALKARLGEEPVVKAEVVKDGAFGKLAVAITASRTVVAQKGLFGVTTYEVAGAMPAPAGGAPGVAAAMPMPVPTLEVEPARPSLDDPTEVLPAPPAGLAGEGFAAEGFAGEGFESEGLAIEAAAEGEGALDGDVALEAGPPATKPKASRAAKPKAKPKAKGSVKPRRAPAKAKAKARAAKAPAGDLEEAIEGIGPAYAAKLGEAGVATVADLLAAKPEELAQRADIPGTLVASWQAMARLQAVPGIGPQYSELLVRAGVTDVAELARSTPGPLAALLAEYQSGLGVAVQGNAITEVVVQGWIRAARDLATPGGKA